MSSSTILLSLFNYKSWANDEIYTALQKLDRAGHKDALHTAIRMMNHMYVVDRIFHANLLGIKHQYTATNTPETPTLAGLLEAVKETDSWYINYVSELDTHALEESVFFSFVDGDTATTTREEMLFHIVTHGAYHRGVVGRILAQLSIAPPRDIFTKYLHDSEPSRRAQI